MSTPQIILGILLFALVTAVLYVWGLRRSMTRQQDLERILLSKSAARVIRYLKKNPVITQKEMANQIRGMKAGLFWSRDRMQVQNAASFAQKLARYMVEQHLLEETGNGRYRLRR